MANEIFDEYGNDPIKLCNDWLLEARDHEINDPEAACLATCDKDGRPSARMILIKDINEAGFKFYTNANSRKGQDIAQNPNVSLCFYWKSIRKQIRIEGRIKQVSKKASDEYFTARPMQRQVGAWASNQSEPFHKKDELENAFKKYMKEFAGKLNIPRPPHWKGFYIEPTSIEFWIAHKFRLHTRFVYTRQDDGTWKATWLCP